MYSQLKGDLSPVGGATCPGWEGRPVPGGRGELSPVGGATWGDLSRPVPGGRGDLSPVGGATWGDLSRPVPGGRGDLSPRSTPSWWCTYRLPSRVSPITTQYQATRKATACSLYPVLHPKRICTMVKISIHYGVRLDLLVTWKFTSLHNLQHFTIGQRLTGRGGKWPPRRGSSAVDTPSADSSEQKPPDRCSPWSCSSSDRGALGIGTSGRAEFREEP
ncbi:hypothetical protein CRUP_037047 [Coryphaenoides rupestris]|nr:hypothetical protein CRUP_037047 [Coryphaenoides rupestris]